MLFRHFFVAEGQIKDNAHNRQGQDDDDPGKLVGGVFLLADQPDNGDDAEDSQSPNITFTVSCEAEELPEDIRSYMI